VVRHPAFPWTLAALFLALAVAFAALWLGARGGDEREPEVLAASRRFLEALTNFSAETIEQDVREIRSFGVGQFLEELDETFSESFIADLKEKRGVSVGEIESVHVQSLRGSTATVFGVVTQTLDNASLPAPRVEVLRAEIQLIETPDGWRVSSVSALQVPGAGTFG
jgi:hypothetical protein